MKNNASKAGQALAEKRWKGSTKAERSAVASHAASAPRSDKRCFCGQHSMLRAAARYFDCCRKAGVIEVHLERLRDGLQLRLEEVKEDGDDGKGT